MHTLVEIRPFAPADEPAVIALWHACNLVSPATNPSADIARKLKVNPELFLVAQQEKQIVGTVMAGYEGRRGWINYLAVAPTARRQGIGRQLMAAAESRLRALGCPKVNLQVRKTNHDVRKFYEALGFAEDAVISFGKRLQFDQPQSTKA